MFAETHYKTFNLSHFRPESNWNTMDINRKDFQLFILIMRILENFSLPIN